MRFSQLTVGMLTSALVACGGNETPGSTLPPGQKVIVGDTGAEIEPSASGIRAFVTTNEHRSWMGDPQVRDKTMNSPHGKVRVFFNRASIETLRAGITPLPVGAMIVKELYENDGATLDGYTVMVKATASSWTWLEAFLTSLDAPAAFGADHASCKPCHSGAGNLDQVRSPLP